MQSQPDSAQEAEPGVRAKGADLVWSQIGSSLLNLQVKRTGNQVREGRSQPGWDFKQSHEGDPVVTPRGRLRETLHLSGHLTWSKGIGPHMRVPQPPTEGHGRP